MKFSVPSKLNVVCISILMLISLALWRPRYRGPLDLRWDAGVYYILGTSLAEGKGYRLLNEPGDIQAIQYPPLLPLLVAAYQRLAGSSDPALVGHLLRISYFGIFLALILAIFRLSQYYLRTELAFLATLVTLLHLNSIWMSEVFFSELPFALLSVLFLLVTPAKGRSRQWIAGALAVLCFLLRSSGVALLGAWAGESLIRRRFKDFALRAAVALVPFLVWQGYIQHVRHSADYTQPAYPYQRAPYQFYNVSYVENLEYVDPFVPELGKESSPFFIKRILHNARILPESLGAAVTVKPDWMNFWLTRPLRRLGIRLTSTFLTERLPFLVLGTMVLSGLLLVTIQGEWSLALYTASSFGLICLTPWPRQFDRYLWPLTPVLAIALFTALVSARNYFSPSGRGKWRSAMTIGVAAVVLWVLSTEVVALRRVFLSSSGVSYKTAGGEQGRYTLFFYNNDWRDHDEALDWLGEHAKPGAIVATSTPQWVFLKTGLRSVLLPFEANVHEAQRLLDSVPVNYLIVDNLETPDVARRYGAPIAETSPQSWELVYSSAQKSSRIYRRTVPENATNQRGILQ